MFNFLFKRDKLDDKRIPRFMWKDKNLDITKDRDFDPNSSLTLSVEEKQEFKERDKNKHK